MLQAVCLGVHECKPQELGNRSKKLHCLTVHQQILLYLTKFFSPYEELMGLVPGSSLIKNLEVGNCLFELSVSVYKYWFTHFLLKEK